MNIVYLNGQFLPKEQATISVFDRGFLFADAIYEVIPVYHGRFIGVDEHLARLKRSLDAVHIPSPLTSPQWLDVFTQLLQRNNVTNSATIYLQVSRGAEMKRDHHISPNLIPTVFAYIAEAKINSYEELAHGFKAITMDDPRRRDCYIKSTCLLPSILAAQQAHQHDCIEAIFIRNGNVLEGTSSNVFIVKDEILITPPLSENMLGGVTREVILKLARENNIPAQERTIPEDELDTADEIWVTGSIKEICPIVTLNERAVGTGKVGPMWLDLIGLYYQYKNK